MTPREHGDLFIVSSPSGAGKTTLIRRVLQDPRIGGTLHFSVSHTTRPPRAGETDGVEYHFCDEASFRTLESEGGFLEWATVHGHLYGTSRQEVEPRLAAGTDVLLDIDVQGARQVRASAPDAVKVFIFPPSHAELRRRLVARRQDGDATIALRIRNAVQEMREYAEFDFAIINDRLEEATRELACIVAAARLRPFRVRAKVQAVLEEFERAVKEEE